MVAAGGNALNDVYDLEIDRINRPLRPLPRGELPVGVARFWGYLLMAGGSLVGFLISFNLGCIALFVSLLLWIYSAELKRIALIGNAAVSVCGALAFIYGALAVGNLRGGIIPAIFAFLIHLSREIVKDIEDLSGDVRAGARTLPIVGGVKFAQKAAAGVLMVLIIATLIPWGIDIYSARYGALIILLVDMPLIVITAALIKDRPRISVSTISRGLKAIMIIGLVVLYIG